MNGVAELSDHAAYDLIWMPAPFLALILSIGMRLRCRTRWRALASEEFVRRLSSSREAPVGQVALGRPRVTAHLPLTQLTQDLVNTVVVDDLALRERGHDHRKGNLFELPGGDDRFAGDRPLEQVVGGAEESAHRGTQ